LKDYNYEPKHCTPPQITRKTTAVDLRIAVFLVHTLILERHNIMKRLRLVSFLGLILSLLAHLVSWATPNTLHFALIGIPLHIIAIVTVAKLYNKRVLPLQDKKNLKWLYQASSGAHALMFLAGLSLIFHTIIVALHGTAFIIFLIRAVSSIWLYVYTVGYAYATWAGQNQFRFKQNQQMANRARIRQKGDVLKSELQIHPPQTMKRRF
jgi:hypothetical protein